MEVYNPSQAWLGQVPWRSPQCPPPPLEFVDGLEEHQAGRPGERAAPHGLCFSPREMHKTSGNLHFTEPAPHG